MSNYSIVLLIFVAISQFASGAAIAQNRAELAVRLLVTLCVSGGSITITKSNEPGRLKVGDDASSVTIQKKEIVGLVDGINSAISNIAADQANKARECMKPYVPRLISIATGDNLTDLEDQIREVSTNVFYTPAPSESPYEYIANFNLVYKNESAYDVNCRFIATGILRYKNSRRAYKKSQQYIFDYKLKSGDAKKIDGKVGIAGHNDDIFAVSYDRDNSCW